MDRPMSNFKFSMMSLILKLRDLLSPRKELLREAGMNWLRVFDAYSVQFLVLSLHSESGMVKFFRSQPGWSVDFEDEEVVIFVRDEKLQDAA